MIVSNKLDSATITIPNPYNYNNSISIYISLSKRTKNSVKIINDYPYISCDVFVEGYVLTLDDTIDLSDSETVQVINDRVNSYLERLITDYLYKTSKDFKSDIDNFGSHVLSNYLTWDKWKNSDWLNNYTNSFFSVNVNSNIVSGYLFNKF